ncbi:MAG: DNA replication and repair protein RecF [Flavobacteriaceae bacterium]|nr:DNA replication and repair protein RecF [Flavobacteriaceae bacterium]
MILKRLSLLNFKNIEQADFKFDAHVNCFVGKNGVGKTNALDSIYALAFGKSYFNPITSQNIRHGNDFFVIDGTFDFTEKEERIILSVKKGQKKVIKKNGKVYDRISDHVGHIPLVIISPSDRDLITEGSEVRRKFIDGIIAQSSSKYLQSLLNYNKVLSQRNALLKFFAVNRTFNQENIDVYDEQLAKYGTYILNKRNEFLDNYLPLLKKRYVDISGNATEKIDLTYKTRVNETSYLQLLKQALKDDLKKQYSTLGIHKDDLVFQLNDFPIKKFGSQGQQKSFLIALKFAQFDFLRNLKGIKPILLLDDVFDKLDENRVTQIISMIMRDDLGQLFISDTHAERTEKVVKENTSNYKMIYLN